MTIDNILGEGATEAFAAAMTVSDNEPTITYSDWEYAPPSIEGGTLTVDVENIWPGAGTWKLVNVIWSDVSQQVFFQDGVMYWGNGICGNGGLTPDTMYLRDRLGNVRLKEFLLQYVREMLIMLPDLPEFYEPFINAGFEREETSAGAKMSVTITPTCRNIEWIDWLDSGGDPATEPAWRI